MNSHSQLLYPSSRPGTPEPPKTQENPTRRVLPGRERRPTEKGHSWQSQVSQDIKARAQREVKQKRKAEAEARPNSKAPGPIDTPSKRRKGEWSQAIDESILRKPYEELTTDDDRAKWYRAAIYRRDGLAYLPPHFDLVELKEMFDDPYAAGEGAQPPEELEDETVTILPREDVDEEPSSGPAPNEVASHSCTPTPQTPLGLSDYTITMSDGQSNRRCGRDESGKDFPLSSSGNVGKPPDKGKPKAGTVSIRLILVCALIAEPVDNRPTLGPQHRPKDAAPPARFQNSSVAKLRVPQAPTTTTANRSRSSLPSSVHATHAYAPNPPSRGVGKPSRATPAQPSMPVKPSTLVKPSRNAAATSTSKSTRRSNFNSAGSTRNAARPSDPRSKPPNQSSIAQKPKSSKVSSTWSAKHQKSRHKGGRRAEAPRTHLRRQLAVDEGEGDDEDQDEGEVKDEGENVKGGTSSRSSRKPGDFGELTWLVRAVGVRIKIRALKKNPYADFTIRYSEPDENGEMHPNGYILDEWLTEEWRRVWGRRYPYDRVPRIQQRHVKWIYDRLSRLRNGVKAAVSPKINHVYNLSRRKSVEENKATVQRLGVDAFLSPTLTAGDCSAFQHPIFQEVIQDAFFSRIGRSFGYKHPLAFKPVPMGVYGLVATMVC
ncbi:hypothetical protein RSOLAG22IIIB_12800 [Rhizoctonia solani]|uniref:DUF6532 domain-containing protein n=1 Tax=Rhizoctonia solani TaxID=456999 RepID=A0A0K6GGU4_9AGAM|nr:hypothetical protein RSOLAG22IIIB_12800 [Rhizoctonia solani]